MSEYTLEQLLTTDRDELTRICAEVCYGWEYCLETQSYTIHTLPDSNEWEFAVHFQPLDNTVSGRSQAFALAVKFDCFPHKLLGMWMVERLTDECLTVEHNNPQAAIVIAAILTAQQEKTNECIQTQLACEFEIVS